MSLKYINEKGLLLDLPQLGIKSLFPKGSTDDYEEFIYKQVAENKKKPLRMVASNVMRFVNIVSGVNKHPRMHIATMETDSKPEKLLIMASQPKQKP